LPTSTFSPRESHCSFFEYINRNTELPYNLKKKKELSYNSWVLAELLLNFFLSKVEARKKQNKTKQAHS